MINRGNGYWQADCGCRDACLITADYYTGDTVIARTDGDIIIAYADKCSKQDEKEVVEWADEYGYPVEWV